MSETIVQRAYAIAGRCDNGKRFLYYGTYWSRVEAITSFCWGQHTGATELTRYARGRGLQPDTRAAWKEHRKKGRRCVMVDIRARIK